jgi:hypothetical protein
VLTENPRENWLLKIPIGYPFINSQDNNIIFYENSKNNNIILVISI